ncbi:MAG: MFS transporter, partial [Tepidisphaeraceae bacterium]
MPADIPDASTANAADVPATSPVANELPVGDLRSPPWYRSYRWVICALLFFATTINYVDRAVFGVLGPTLQKEMGWSPTQFGDVNAAFTLAYAIGFLFVGWFIDRVG